MKDILESLGWLGIVALWYWPLTLGVVAVGYLVWLVWRIVELNGAVTLW